MKTDLAPTLAPDLTPEADVSLLLRADLPVIWDAFKAKAEQLRKTAETLTVTSIDQKDEMALARTTRLTLREIRIAVEAKRVELGESHLKEIKKVNGAATAIKDFIQPLEARLLEQEGFADRFEANRIAELTRCRNAELFAIRPHVIVKDVGAMSQENYDGLIAALRAEQAEIEAANRLRIEAERKLAEQAIEMVRQQEAFLANAKALKVAEDARLAAQRAEWAEQDRQRAVEVKAESDRLKAEARATLELAQRVALDVKQRSDADAEAKAKEYQAELLAQRNRQQERDAEHQARLDAEKAVRDADLAEQKRIRDEQLAVLEAELAQERAAKQAEADAARKLALAPDLEKLQGYIQALLSVPLPCLKDSTACFVLQNVVDIVNKAAYQVTCFQNNLTSK